MTTSIDALERKLDRLKKQSSIFQPRLYTFCLEDGDDIPANDRVKIRPSDQVVIRFYPRGLLGNI